MPNLITIAQRLAQAPALALLNEERCLPVRDSGSRCSQCAEACPIGAVEIGEGALARGAIGYGSVEKTAQAGPRIDEEACARCGSCVAACPTGALVPAPPCDDEALMAEAARIGKAAQEALAETDAKSDGSPDSGGPALAPPVSQATIARDAGSACETAALDPGEPGGKGRAESAAAGFACARMAQTVRIDAERTAVLPCIAWVDEALIVHAACRGARRIVLLTENCATCRLARAVEALPQAAAEAQRILDAWGVSCEVVYAQQGAEGLASPLDTGAAGELSRRNLFAQARSAVSEAAVETAKTQLDAFVGKRVEDIAREVEPDRRRWQLLDDLHAFGLPADDTVVPRVLAPRVDIDADSCSGCALCAEFCPTGALRKSGKGANGTTLLEFDAALCRDCATCTDTCRYSAISREETLSVAELFALEPRTIVIPKRRVLPERR